jgi:hypothetical protein
MRGLSSSALHASCPNLWEDTLAGRSKPIYGLHAISVPPVGQLWFIFLYIFVFIIL